MKKILLSSLALVLLCGCAAKQECPVCETCTVTEYVDSFTSASGTKNTLTGDELSSTISLLKEIDSDLATKAETEAEGYTANENESFVELMSINPDGTPGISTIHAWRINEDNTLTVVLTDGQCGQNLAKVNARGTIMVHGDSYYLIHLNVKDVNTLEYSDDNYNNGLFNSSYSGASNKLCEYTITSDILSIERVNLYLPN